MGRRTPFDTGGRGTGRPPDRITYGTRTCHLVCAYKTQQEASRKAQQLEYTGIMAIVRKWYSWWATYRCGARIRRGGGD